MEIWRVSRMLPGVVFICIFSSSDCEADYASNAKPHSILSVSYALKYESPDRRAFVLRDEAPRIAAQIQRPLPEPYSYVLASVGIASLLAMGGVYRVRKPSARPTRGSVRNRVPGPRGNRR